MGTLQLAKHDFDGHIFPQIKRFFTFFKNSDGRNDLIEKLFQYIKSNPQIEQKFKEFIGNKEIYKTLKDIMEKNQNILLIIDENKPEFQETADTITQWDQFVKVEILKKYTANDKNIFVLNPDFGEISFEAEESGTIYDEHYHLDGVNPPIISAYNKIKDSILKIDASGQGQIYCRKNYIAFKKAGDNIFISFHIHKKRMWMSIHIPYDSLIKIIKKHKVAKDAGGRSYSSIKIEDDNNLEEVARVIEEAFELQK